MLSQALTLHCWCLQCHYDVFTIHHVSFCELKSLKGICILMEYHNILNNNSTENVDSNKLLQTMEMKEAAAEGSPNAEQDVSNSNNFKKPPPGRDIKNGKRFILALIAFMVITLLNWNIPRYQWPWKFLTLEKQQPQMLSLPAQLKQYYNLRAAQQVVGRPVMSTFFEPVKGGV